MSRAQTGRIDALGLGLSVYAALCCAVIGALAFGFYELMQPTRLSNPGIAAYQFPSNAAVGLASIRQPARFGLIRPSTEPAQETTAAAPQAQADEKEAAKAKRVTPTLPRATKHKQWRGPMRDYAYRPFYGGSYGAYGGRYGGYWWR